MTQFWKKVTPYFGKRILVFAIAAVLVVAVPLTVYMAQTQQNIQQEAAGKKNNNKSKNDKDKNDKNDKNNKNDKKKDKKNTNKKHCSKKERKQGNCKKNPKPKPKKGAVDRTLDLTLLLHGIGSGGDQVNAQGVGTTDPLRPERAVFVEVYDSNNELAGEAEGTVMFDEAEGNFKGSVTVPLTKGAYTAIVDLDYYPAVAVPGIINIGEKSKDGKKNKKNQKQKNDQKNNNNKNKDKNDKKK